MSKPKENSEKPKNLMNNFINVMPEPAYKEVLNLLIDGDTDIDLKTEINKPKEITTLKLLSSVLGDLNYIKTAKSLSLFIEYFSRYMFSNKRKSRKEIVQTLATASNIPFSDEFDEAYKKMFKNQIK